MGEAGEKKSRQEQMVAEMAELAGGLAHELRNPLSTMMINLKLLSEDLSGDDARLEDVRRRALIKVDRLRREAERLQSLFDEFLRLTGSYRLSLKNVGLNLLVRELVDFVTPMATNQGVSIRFEPDSADPLCLMDENLLRQALLNLLINAQQAMPDGGTLTIRTTATADRVAILVSDTGVGISDKDMVRVLRPFFSTKRDGNGLGLSITQRVAREHGGQLSLESELGRGTTATLSIPRRAGVDA